MVVGKLLPAVAADTVAAGVESATAVALSAVVVVALVAVVVFRGGVTTVDLVFDRDGLLGADVFTVSLLLVVVVVLIAAEGVRERGAAFRRLVISAALSSSDSVAGSSVETGIFSIRFKLSAEAAVAGVIDVAATEAAVTILQGVALVLCFFRVSEGRGPLACTDIY